LSQVDVANQAKPEAKPESLGLTLDADSSEDECMLSFQSAAPSKAEAIPSTSKRLLLATPLRKGAPTQSPSKITPSPAHHKLAMTPATALEKENDEGWEELCEGWEYRWAGGAEKSVLRKAIHGIGGRRLWMRETKNRSDAFVVREGDYVFYQYDDAEAIAKVQELYKDEDGEPMFAHSVYYTHEDMEEDEDDWDLPEDGVPFNEKHEVVFCGQTLRDPCWRILRRCTVRRVADAEDTAIKSAIARCDREEDSFFWRYQVPHQTNAERLGLLSTQPKERATKRRKVLHGPSESKQRRCGDNEANGTCAVFIEPIQTAK